MKRIFQFCAMKSVPTHNECYSWKSIGMQEFDLDEVDEIVIPVNYECEVSMPIGGDEVLHGDVSVVFSFNEICDLLNDDSFGSPVVIRRDNRFKDKFDKALDLIYMKLVMEK